MRWTIRLGVLLTLTLVGCGSDGGSSTEPALEETAAGGEEEPSARSAGEVGARAENDERRAAPARTGPAPPELLATLAPPEREETWAALDAAVARCPPPRDATEDARNHWYDSCQPPSTVAYDASTGGWVVLDVDHSEGGPERYALSLATPSQERSLAVAEIEPATIESLSRALAAHNAPTPVQLVAKRTEASFSLNLYAPLVELGGPLDGWRLWIETTDDLDRPEHVLWLVHRDGSPVHMLGRRAATTGPCDGGGYWCEATQAECDAAGLRAEGRLCVLPLGIDRVATAGGTIAIQGLVQVAGHGGYPAYHWIAALPDDL